MKLQVTVFLLSSFAALTKGTKAFSSINRVAPGGAAATVGIQKVFRRRRTTSFKSASIEPTLTAGANNTATTIAEFPTTNKQEEGFSLITTTDPLQSSAELVETTTTTTSNDVIEGKKQQQQRWIQSIDGIVFVSYLSNVMALSLPVLLVPIAAAEQIGTGGDTMKIASAVAGISSIATLGGATGKFTNGFICQAMGSYKCSQLYFYGLSACAFILSLTTSSKAMGLAYAGMEFFASVQWAALAVMLSNYYEKSPAKLATALTALGLSSTSGQIAAKTLGMTLASTLHWRIVAQIGALTALIGGLFIGKAPRPDIEPAKEQVTIQSIGNSLRVVLGNPLFWLLALSHGMAFVARGTDRILGTFFEHMVPGMSRAISGGLTLSITMGLITGLTSGSKKFTSLSTVNLQKKFLAKRYIVSVLATIGLTITAKFGPTIISSKLLLTSLVAILSGIMANNIAFQYFQFPAMIAKSKFNEQKPIVISFLDGFGFLLSAPIFAATSKLVPSKGWSTAWGMLATLFGTAAIVMLSSIGPVLHALQDNNNNNIDSATTKAKTA